MKIALLHLMLIGSAAAASASAGNRTAGMEGDGAGPMTSRVQPAEVPETESPIQTLEAQAADGRAVRAFWRKPKGDGPFPAVVFIHGGLTQFTEEMLRRQLKVNPVVTRLFASGYAVAQATFRTYEQHVQSRGPIEDVRAVVHTLAQDPAVDAKRIALFGGSGGGSIALELGSDPAVSAVVAGEPATVLYTGMLTTGEYGPRLEIMAAPEKYFTPELRRHTLEKLRELRAPVLILHSDQHDLRKLNGPLFVPLMKEAGVKVEYREYPGYGHGFYFGGGGDRWGKAADEHVVGAVIHDVAAFLAQAMPATAVSGAPDHAPAKRRARGDSAAQPPAAADVNAPQFRGPRGDGVAYGSNLPVAWSTTSNVVWSCAIPGKGWSSPVVWGDRVFVTSAVGPGSVEAPPEKLGSVADHVRGVSSADEHRYMLYCVEWQTGQVRWSRCAHQGVPPGLIHPKNSYASETPVTDGERVYACFGNVGLFCYDMDGRELWSRKWGSFKMGWNWGTSASPVVRGDRLFVLNDNQERSFLAALDTRTGQDVWRVERDEKSNWTNPFVWQNDARPEIVTSGSGKVRSYDLSGNLLWELRGMSSVTVPTPFAADGLLYIASGCPHSARRPVYAIRPGASGDISPREGASNNAHIAWCQRQAAPYVTSPLAYGGLLYVLLDNGYLAAYDARTGKPIYGKQRFTEGRTGFSASPWAYDGKVFCLSEAGDTYVVEAGPEFRVLHVNRLGEAALATPAVARDSLVIRTLTKLYRIANELEVKRL